LARPKSIGADAADGTDVVIGSAFTCGRYRDCPRSQPPLAAEDNLDPEGAEGGLHVQAMHRRIEECPEDVRAGELKLLPKQLGGASGIEEDVRTAHGVRPSSGRPMAT
jgi:hypothetical protein